MAHRPELFLHAFALAGGANADAEPSRPSSSGGRLQQHLGAVEYVDMTSSTTAASSKTSLSGAVGLPGKVTQCGSKKVATGLSNRHGADVVVGTLDIGLTPASGRRKGCAASSLYGNNSRIHKGGNNGGIHGRLGFASSMGKGTTTVDDGADHLRQQPPPPRRSLDASGQPSLEGRRARDRKGGGSRRRSAEDVHFGGSGPQAGEGTHAFGTTSVKSSTKGAHIGRGKTDGSKPSRPQRASSRVSFGSSIADGGRSYGYDRSSETGGDRGARGQGCTHDNKFRSKAGHSNTLVAVRLRPLLKHDREHVEVAKVGCRSEEHCLAL